MKLSSNFKRKFFEMRPKQAFNSLYRPMQRYFAVEVSSGKSSVELKIDRDGKVATKPLYFDNQATTPMDPR